MNNLGFNLSIHLLPNSTPEPSPSNRDAPSPMSVGSMSLSTTSSQTSSPKNTSIVPFVDSPIPMENENPMNFVANHVQNVASNQIAGGHQGIQRGPWVLQHRRITEIMQQERAVYESLRNERRPDRLLLGGRDTQSRLEESKTQ